MNAFEKKTLLLIKRLVMYKFFRVILIVPIKILIFFAKIRKISLSTKKKLNNYIESRRLKEFEWYSKQNKFIKKVFFAIMWFLILTYLLILFFKNFKVRLFKKKPVVILALEKEINCHFKEGKIDTLSKINFLSKAAKYSTDKDANIVELLICCFELKEIPKSITQHIYQLKFLESLYLFKNQIIDISTVSNLINIKELDLSSNQISKIDSLYNLTNLKTLSLGSNQISDISPLYNLINLQSISLSFNQITNIDSLSNLINLRMLYLDGNPIRTLSKWVCDFPYMDIKWFELLDLSLENSDGNFIFMSENPIESPPIEIIKQGKAAIKAWFAEQKKTVSIPNPYVKLILIGNTTVGKTSLINFITNRTFNEGEISTHGINQNNWKPDKKNLIINIWDFGGQEYYHSTHQLFFSNNALYLLLFDKEHNKNGWIETKIDYSDNENVLENLEHFDYFYWLQNIRSLSKNSKILMVQNKVENPKDKVYPNNEVFDENLEYKVDDYQAISVLNAYNYFKENNKLSNEFEGLQDLIISKLEEVKRGEIFEYYIRAKELIENAAQKKPVINIDELIEICKPVNENIANIITDENGNETEYPAWKLMCVYFHETGVLLYYPESQILKDKIFIRPTFVTNSIYKVLNYKVKENFGSFTYDDAVQSLGYDNELAKSIIELMSAPNFKLIFNKPETLESYIAPQFLDDKRPHENILKHITRDMEIGFVLEFTNFLPKFILGEFMVEYGRFQKDDSFWKYGIVFEKYQCTAFVECLFAERKIIYKSEIKEDSIRLKYEVFETIRNINRNDKNLNISIDANNYYPFDTVKKDSKNDMFYLFREGYRKYQSKLKENLTEDRIILMQIINACNLAVDNAKQQGLLREDFKKGEKGEDKRTNYLKAILNSAMPKYYFDEQNKGGIAGNGDSEGNIDIAICRKNKKIKFSIIEALNHRNKKNLISHFNKSVANYNQVQHRFIFLLTYYEGKDRSRDWEKYKSWLKGIQHLVNIEDISNISDNQCIKIANSEYELDSNDITRIYHIFVDFSKKINTK